MSSSSWLSTLWNVCLIGSAVAAVSIVAFYYLVPRRKKRSLVLKLLRAGPPVTKLAEQSYQERTLPHSALEQIGSLPLWIVHGTLPQPGPKFNRIMLIYRIPSADDSGSLLIHSPVCVNDEVRRQIEALGRVCVIIAPNSFHRMDLEAFKHVYKDAIVVTPAKAIEAVSECVRVDRVVEDIFVEANVDYCDPKDGAESTLASVEYMRPDGAYDDYDELLYILDLPDTHEAAMVVCDLFFNLNASQSNLVVQLLGSAGGFKCTSMGKLCMIENLTRFREWILKRLLPLARRRRVSVFVVAHGDTIEGHDHVCKHLQMAASRLLE